MWLLDSCSRVLGYKITYERILVGSTKIDTILFWENTKGKIKIQISLGWCIAIIVTPETFEIVTPSTRLTGKRIKSILNDAYEVGFKNWSKSLLQCQILLFRVVGRLSWFIPTFKDRFWSVLYRKMLWSPFIILLDPELYRGGYLNLGFEWLQWPYSSKFWESSPTVEIISDHDYNIMWMKIWLVIPISKLFGWNLWVRVYAHMRVLTYGMI